MTQILCDHCKRDLTTTGNSMDYRLLLKSEEISAPSGPVTDMWIEPAISRDHHFCNLKCLKEWVLD